MPNPLCGGFTATFTQNSDGTSGTGDLAALIAAGFNTATNIATISPVEASITKGDYSITVNAVLDGNSSITASQTFTVVLDDPCALATLSLLVEPLDLPTSVSLSVDP